MLLNFIKNDDRAKEYRDLDWSEEYKLAREGLSADSESAL